MRCIDGRVLIGLGTVAAGVFWFEPNWMGAAVPLLVALACPLSMLLMMRRGAPTCTTGSERADDDVTEVRAEIARLRAEIETQPHLQNA